MFPEATAPAHTGPATADHARPRAGRQAKAGGQAEPPCRSHACKMPATSPYPAFRITSPCSAVGPPKGVASTIGTLDAFKAKDMGMKPPALVAPPHLK